MIAGVLPSVGRGENGTPGEKGRITPSRFVRFIESEDKAKLQTAVVRLVGRGGATVDLVGAVHVADKVYYQKLNRRFEGYDAVLYELVGDPADLAKLPDAKPDAEENPIRFMQGMIRSMLQLGFQLDEVDYSKANFVHADLSVAEFTRLQEERGESLMTFVERAFASEIKKANEGEESNLALNAGELFKAMMSNDSADRMKMIFGKQLSSAEVMIEDIEAMGDTVILTERNKVLFERLKRALSDGGKNLAVFFGAAHLRDVERMLVGELGFRRVQIEWVNAWDIKKPVEPAPSEVEEEAGDADSGNAKREDHEAE
jgi:hypothetical protein